MNQVDKGNRNSILAMLILVVLALSGITTLLPMALGKPKTNNQPQYTITVIPGYFGAGTLSLNDQDVIAATRGMNPTTDAVRFGPGTKIAVLWPGQASDINASGQVAGMKYTYYSNGSIAKIE